jgi:hypothetical protein
MYAKNSLSMRTIWEVWTIRGLASLTFEDEDEDEDERSLTDERDLIPTVFTKRLMLTDRLSTLFGS